ncbi:MAG: M36 family metallopeptidase [Candidatus Riflebacteria bacterium]|nr:M36 family metallopeptidase [Candidatus Riflebacteria bacterium]
MKKSLLVIMLLCNLFVVFASEAVVFSTSQTPNNGPTTRQIQPDLRIIERIQGNYRSEGQIQAIALEEQGQRLSSIRGELSEAISGDLSEAALAYVYSFSDVFNLPTTPDRGWEIKTTSVSEDKGTTHVTLNLEFDNVKLFKNTVGFHFGSDKVIKLINGSFPKIEKIVKNPLISSDDAIQLAKKFVGTTGLRIPPVFESVFYAENGTAMFSYLVKLASKEPLGDYEVVINAQTGEKLSLQNQMDFLGISGKGSVYVSNPKHCSVTVEPLPNLTSTSLSGAYCEINNEKASVTTNANHEYVFDPKDVHFDEVNAYYHVNRIHDFFKSLGFNGLDSPMKTVVHFQAKPDQAYYSVQEGRMVFGDGVKYNDLAMEEAVFYHEYSHAAMKKIVVVDYANESGAINEGQADYFACSLSNDPIIGEWAASKDKESYFRKIENVLHYPEALVYEVHADGRIWAGCCWDLRKSLGAEISDILIHKSFYFLKPQNPEFFDGYNALLAADKSINGGKYQAAITDVFQKRGIAKTRMDGFVFDSSDLAQMRKFSNLQGE